MCTVLRGEEARVTNGQELGLSVPGAQDLLGRQGGELPQLLSREVCGVIFPEGSVA